jgi:hypothetical protein
MSSEATGPIVPATEELTTEEIEIERERSADDNLAIFIYFSAGHASLTEDI